MPPTPTSRFCTKCKRHWPNEISRFSTCPDCRIPTVFDRVVESDFDSTEMANAEIARIVASRESHELFEKYYQDVHVPTLANKLLDEIKRWDKLTPADLAAEFATLVQVPTKEETHGAE